MNNKGEAGIKNSLAQDKEYSVWFKELKNKVRSVQIKAAVKVNSELLQFYWELGADIVKKQATSQWGDGFISRLSHDLMVEFPAMKGFSSRNLKYIKQWYLFYSQEIEKSQQGVDQISSQDLSQSKKSFGQQAVAQLTQIPWGHNIFIISKCKNIDKALYYVQNTINYNWSRSVLVHQIESGLYEREGKSITNFKSTLPKPQSDLASQTLKDPYIFDFLTMTKDYNELEKQLSEIGDYNE